MSVVIGILVLCLAVFQLFFRYDHWPSREVDGAVYERDSLTGEVYVVRPGDPVDPVARLLGQHDTPDATVPVPQAPAAASKTGDAGEVATLATIGEKIRNMKAIRKGREFFGLSMVATSRGVPPEPGMGSNSPARHYVTRKIDLNRDGTDEEIIQRITANDGLIDISIVQPSGRELLYGRGQALHILSSRRLGWSDLALETGANTEVFYRYNPKIDSYQRVERLER